MSLIKIINKSLASALIDASNQCKFSHEEEGGVILKKTDSNDDDAQFKFIKVNNQMRGAPEAGGLYVACREGFGTEVCPSLAQGWVMYGSFHTHPTFSATPSWLDKDKLFRGFKYNFIFSNIEELFSCSEWSGQNNLNTIYLGIDTFIKLTNEQN